MSNIYLDYAAATPMSDEATKAMRPYLQEKFHNSSAVYLASRGLKKELNGYRERVAHWLGVRGEEVIFTAGASESDNLAIHGIMRKFSDANLAVSAIEHEAVLEAAKHYDSRVIKVDNQGRISPKNLEDTVDDKTVLVSIMHANNEIGTIQPLSELSDTIESIRKQRRKSGNDLPLYLHTDASQSAQYLDLHVNRLGVDLMTLNAGKIYGPKQVGALYIGGGVEIEPLIEGGGQERSLRSGTENLAGAAAMAAAMDLVQSQRSQESKRVKLLRDELESRLSQSLGNFNVHGGKHRLPNMLSFDVEGIDGERAVMELDEAGIQCGTGSACSALKDSSSHVLKAMGLSESRASSSLRLSLGRHTSEKDVETAAGIIAEVLTNNKQ